MRLHLLTVMDKLVLKTCTFSRELAFVLVVSPQQDNGHECYDSGLGIIAFALVESQHSHDRAHRATRPPIRLVWFQHQQERNLHRQRAADVTRRAASQSRLKLPPIVEATSNLNLFFQVSLTPLSKYFDTSSWANELVVIKPIAVKNRKTFFNIVSQNSRRKYH